MAGTELLIGHGGILHRDDFARFVHTGTSNSDGTTLMAWIDWDAALSALHDRQIWSVPAFLDTELGCQLAELPIS